MRRHRFNQTLSKAALHHAKTSAKARRLVDLSDGKSVDAALKRLPVGEVWGIGPARADLLTRYGSASALMLREADNKWVK